MTYQGIVVRFTERKMWGFIQGNHDGGDGGEIFFHLDNSAKGTRVSLGAEVEYEIGRAFTLNKPPQAINVRLVQLAQPVEGEGSGGTL